MAKVFKMLDEKYRRLCEIIRRKKSAVVAFSGGVDSSVLAAVAYSVLGENAMAVTVKSPTMPESELECAIKVAREIGVPHIVVEHDELSNKKFKSNPKDRCYYCKIELAKVLKKISSARGVKSILEGTNAEETRSHRPGFKALKENNISTPLAEAGFTKKDVRSLARRLSLSNANKPSGACLSSRIPYGEEITKARLEKIAEAESIIKQLGVKQLRVRDHDPIARLEVTPQDFNLVLSNRRTIARKLSQLGFRYVTLDLCGYTEGSMNDHSEAS